MFLSFILRTLQDRGLISEDEFMQISDLTVLHEALEGKLKGYISEKEYQLLSEISDDIRQGKQVSEDRLDKLGQSVKKAVKSIQKLKVKVN